MIIHREYQIMATVLVTGASGYIGRFLVKALRERGDSVFVLLRRPEAQAPVLRAWLQGLAVDDAGVEAVQGDLALPGVGIAPRDWVRMQAVTRVYHSGALFGWDLAVEQVRAVNVTGAVSLLEAAVSQLALERFVQVSGYMLTLPEHLAALGIAGDGAATDWPAVYRQTGAYEASKLEGHFAVKRAAARLGVPLTVVHPATLAGDLATGELAEGQEMARTLDDLVAGRLPVVPGGDGYRLPLVSMDYLAAFMAGVADAPDTANREFLLADASSPPLKTVLGWAARAVDKRPPVMAVPTPWLVRLAGWGWLSRRTGMTREKLAFLRREPLDTAAADRVAAGLGLRHPPLQAVLETVARERVSPGRTAPLSPGRAVSSTPSTGR